MRLLTTLLAVVALFTSEVQAEAVTPQRLDAFFKRHKVVKSEYYASLITTRIKSNRHRKVMAALLIPETRGRAHLISSEGAVGPWQLHPYWFNRFGRARRPADNLVACYSVFLIHLEETGSLRGALRDYSGKKRGYADRVLSLMKEI